MSYFKNSHREKRKDTGCRGVFPNSSGPEDILPPWIEKKQGQCTPQDYDQLPPDVHMQLIHGRIVPRAPVSFMHQAVINELLCQIVTYIQETNSPYKAVTFPIHFYLNNSNTILIPDIALILHPERIAGHKITAVPEFVAEVLSPDSRYLDCTEKFDLYREFGVSDYWIIDEQNRNVTVYHFKTKGTDECDRYRFSDRIPVRILDGLYLDLNQI